MSSSKVCLELKVIVVNLEKPFMFKTINKRDYGNLFLSSSKLHLFYRLKSFDTIGPILHCHWEFKQRMNKEQMTILNLS